MLGVINVQCKNVKVLNPDIKWLFLFLLISTVLYIQDVSSNGNTIKNFESKTIFMANQIFFRKTEFF